MIEFLWDQRGLLQLALTASLLAVSLRRGAAPERWCAAILLGAIGLARAEQLLASGFVTLWGLTGFETRAVAYLMIDMLTFVGLAAVAIGANRTYPLWMAGLQLTALLTHVASRATDIVEPLAFAALNLSTFYLMLFLLAGGLAAHIRRERRWGTYPSWRDGWSRSQARTPRRSPKGS